MWQISSYNNNMNWVFDTFKNTLNIHIYLFRSSLICNIWAQCTCNMLERYKFLHLTLSYTYATIFRWVFKQGRSWSYSLNQCRVCFIIPSHMSKVATNGTWHSPQSCQITHVLYHPTNQRWKKLNNHIISEHSA